MLLTKYYSNDQIQKNEMGEACSVLGGEEKSIHSGGGT